MILLVAPSFEPAKTPEQDLDLEVLVAYLRQRGLTVRVLDAQVSRLEPTALAESIRGAGPRVLYWHLARRRGYAAMAAALGQLDGLVPAPLMLAGGDFASRHDLEVLDRVPRLAGVLRGEPEPTLEAAARSFPDGGPWRQLPGISHRGSSGPLRNPPRPLREDLDHLPMAADDLFQPSRRQRGQKVLFSRGCDSDCTYCGLHTPYRESFPQRLRFWRSRSPSVIVDEIEHYHKAKGALRFQFNSFVFFGYDREAGDGVDAVAREILRRGLRISFSFVTHPGHLCRNRDRLPLLREAGLAQLMLGIDSGLPRALELYRVPFTAAESREALAILNEERIQLVPLFIFYDPYLSLEEIHANLRFLEEIEPHFSHLPRPYAYYLDQHLLKTVLKVRAEMPLYRRLLADGLATAVDPLEDEPVVGFKHAETARVFRIQQAVDQVAGPQIRPALFSAEAVSRCPEWNRFPIDLMKQIVQLVEDEVEEPLAAERVLEWISARQVPSAPGHW